MRRALLLVLTLLAAGCVGTTAEEAPPEEAVGPAATRTATAPRAASTAATTTPVGDATSPPPPPVTEPGATLFGATAPVLSPGVRLAFAGACAEACPSSTFRVAEAAGGLVEVRLLWNGSRTAGFEMEVVAPDGSRHAGTRGFDAARVLLVAPPDGDYMLHARGTGDLTGRVHAFVPGAPPDDGGDLLPNLVTLVPLVEERSAWGPGGRTCDPWEEHEQGAKRCLRLGNAIGNVGDGPLEVALEFQQGALSPAMPAAFVQNLFQTSGPPRPVPAGGAVFHPTHGHFHYEGLARFTLYAYDTRTGLRGDAVASHGKAGFCLLDIGEMEEPDAPPETRTQRRAEQECLVPKIETDPSKWRWSMGVSRGHYDLYGAGLTDQYVEITGVEDGVYELVSEANVARTLLETDLDDNAASVLVRLAGDRAEVLEERGFYRVPEE